MNAYALERIRQALQLGANQKEIDAALAALADLERRASCPLGTMASGGSARDRPFTIFTSFDLPPGTPVYSATLIPAGMFTADEMTAAYREGQFFPADHRIKYDKFDFSNTKKLIQERTK